MDIVVKKAYYVKQFCSFPISRKILCKLAVCAVNECNKSVESLPRMERRCGPSRGQIA